MDETPKWQGYLNEAIRAMLSTQAMSKCISQEHLHATPARVVKAMEEDFNGIYKDPAAQLTTAFAEDGYDQMVSIAHVEFTSFCAHHLRPFMGRYTFAYIPNQKIVGLSKIPRMVEVLCARPQVQEQLTRQIVDVFQAKVEPIGCGLVMDAFHTCMCSRGVKKWATTRTVALAGNFKEASVKAELLSTVGPAMALGV